MRLPDILGQVFFAPLIVFPIALSIGMHGTLKDLQKIMAVLLILWLTLLWFGKGVFYHVINISTNQNQPYFLYPSQIPPNVALPPALVKMLPHLEINMDWLNPYVIAVLLIILRWLYLMIL